MLKKLGRNNKRDEIMNDEVNKNIKKNLSKKEISK